MSNIIWHNGGFIEDTPVFTIHDRIRLGDGVFDTMLVVDGFLMHGAAHFEKLIAGSKILFRDWNAPKVTDLVETALDLLERNDFTDGRYAINTVLSRGEAAQGLRTPTDPNIQMVMRVSPLPDTFPPARAIIAKTVRRNEGSPLSQIKNCNYGDNILAMMEAEDNGANEAIMLNNAGNVACATTSNIFIVKDGHLFTPPVEDGVQNGLTRKFIIEKYNAIEKTLSVADLRRSDGIYLTNSIRGAFALQTLDGESLPSPSLEIDKGIHLS